MKKKSIRQSKNLIISLFAAFLCLAAGTVRAQAGRVTIDMQQVKMTQIMDEIEKQTKFLFIYDKNISVDRTASVQVREQPVAEALAQMLAGTDLTYEINSSNIILSKRSADAAASSSLRNVAGVVLDAHGQPIIGASVVIKGTTIGISTNVDGSFGLQIPASVKDPVLVVNYLGCEPQEIAVGSRADFRITMVESAVALDNVVVTALGIKRQEKALSYNVQQVKSEDIVTVKDANFMNALNGKVASVQINSSAAGVGGAARVVMRGAKSLYKDNNALYVIDGIPMSNVSFGSNDDGLQGNYMGSDGVADINPDDIESISVLTGPSAAALYGSDAANGVVLINTKKGQADKTSVTFSNSTTFSSPFVMPRFQNTYGHVSGSYQSWGDKTLRRFDPEGFFNTGSNVNNSLTFSTGTQKHQTYFSAATTNARNILPNSGYNRYNFTFRDVTKFLKDKLTVDLSASYILQDNKNMIAAGKYFNPLPALYLFPRGDDFDNVRLYQRWDESRNLYTQAWDYGSGDMSFQNPYWIMNKMINQTKKRRYMLSANLKYDVTDWLDVTGRVKVDNADMDITEKRYAGTDTNFAGEKGMYSIIKRNDRQIYADAIANIDLTFAGDYHLSANVGASLKDVRMDFMGWGGDLRKIPNFFSITNISTTNYKEREDGSHIQSQSIFANVELAWKSMLYLTVTGRNDWESALAFSKYKSFFYPSVGLSAVVSEMVDMPEWFSFLKVRGSYSAVGSSYAAYLTKPYYDYKGQTHEWDSLHRFPNENLKPEKTKSWEVGLNARFFGGKLNFDATWYRSDTFNQTFESTPSSTSGYSSVLVQAGQVRNSGLEMLLNYHNTWRDFTWNTSVTYTMNRNKIIRLANGVISPVDGQPIDMPYLEKATLGDAGSPQVILYEGGTMGDLYINRELRTDLNGNIYVDPQTNKVELTTTERRKVASLLPKGNIGWSNSFAWKGLNLNVMFAARLGGSVVSNTEAFLDYYGVSERSAAAREAGGVRINNGMVDAQNYYQTIGAGTGAGAYYIYDATNVRMQELSLAYTLPKRWFRQKMAMTVSLVGRNLWMIYNKAPFDPELTPSTADNFLQGVDYFMLPSLRNIGFTVKLQF